MTVITDRDAARIRREARDYRWPVGDMAYVPKTDVTPEEIVDALSNVSKDKYDATKDDKARLTFTVSGKEEGAPERCSGSFTPAQSDYVMSCIRDGHKDRAVAFVGAVMRSRDWSMWHQVQQFRSVGERRKLSILSTYLGGDGLNVPSPSVWGVKRHDGPPDWLITVFAFIARSRGMKAEEGRTVLEEIDRIERGLVSTYLDEAWSALSDDDRDRMRANFRDRVNKTLVGGGPFEARTKEVILQKVAEVAEQELERRVDDLRERVVAEIEKRWTDVVEQIVSKRLAEAVAKIKAEMSRG